MRYLFIVSMFFYAARLCAQQESVMVQFEIDFGTKPLVLHKNYLINGDTINFETVKFYVSNFVISKEGGKVQSAAKKYHLVNMEEGLSLLYDTKISNDNDFDKINFTFGIDSSTNTMGALGGDLDPSKSMYWTWQSGYINCKIEGTASNCPARKHHFQFHLGGYQYPYANCQSIHLKIKKQKIIIIKLPIDKIFEHIQLSNNYEIMSPNAKALELSQYLSTLFSAQ